MSNIRNFSIIAHVDHGKSTLADRMLEVTGTVPERKMREQVLDGMELERERGITIKMTPVRMHWRHLDRRINADSTQKDAENGGFLYKELTYKIRGALFTVRKQLGLGHKEQIYHKAIEIELAKAGLKYVSKPNIPLRYKGEVVGTYQPDFVVGGKVLIELKALPEIGRSQTEQVWSYLKGCEYKLALLVNFGSRDLDVKRIVYDSARSASADSASGLRDSAQVENEYILNLIDTPGHIDFAYEVSRALSAVEGVVLLVDATQGIQAQTLSVLELAKQQNLVVIPALSKIDAALARTKEVRAEMALLLNCHEDDIVLTSGKTGEGIRELLERIVNDVPAPKTSDSTELNNAFRALIFDFEYSDHRGIVLYVRIVGGRVKKGDKLRFCIAGGTFTALETGVFTPDMVAQPELTSGEIGYIVTGIKKPGIVNVGDTVTTIRGGAEPLAGYQEPRPVIWASVYPEDADDLDVLRQALEKLRLMDSSLSYEEEASGIMGRGFRCGFLGMLHMEIIVERLRREFNLVLVVTLPTTVYELHYTNGAVEEVYAPARFPSDKTVQVFEEWIRVHILTPADSMGNALQLLHEHEANIEATETMPDGRTELTAEMPLRELMRNFFDKLKNASSGFASLSYEWIGKRAADVVRLDILIAEEPAPAFSRIVGRRRVEEEARAMVAKIKESLPRQLFVVKIQAEADGRIIASERLSAMRKDVTGYLYGGDVTRKKKLLEKQKKGKKKMLARGRVHIPHEVFMRVMKSD